MRFGPDFLDEIRARLPISTVVGKRVTFDKKKSNPSRGDFWGCCPFHGEKTPSFHCEDPKGRYHCFGCGVSGDIFRFVSELDGLSFPETVERLASEAGVAMPARDVQSIEKEKQKTDLYQVMELAAQFFTHNYENNAGSQARQYLSTRGLSAQTIKKFRLGYAPDSSNALKEYLVSKNISADLLNASGLLVTGDDIAVPYDRFRNRVMFPILDMRERVIGFGGRALAHNARAKYLNSPETDLFHKGLLLYNGANARRACQPQQGRPAQPMIVVEGYMDVIALDQAGIHQAVAPLGTALTEEQINLLWRCSPHPVLCFDGDEAGLKAAYRALDRVLPLLRSEVSLRFTLLPSGKDPDDLVREEGREAFVKRIEEAKPLAEMLWLRETAGKIFDTPEQRAGLEKVLFQTIYAIKDDTLRGYYQRDMREKLRQFFQTPFKNEWKRRGNQKRDGGIVSDPSVLNSLANSPLIRTSKTVLPLREAAILLTLINHPTLWDEDFERLAALEFDHLGLKQLHRTALDVLAVWQPDDAAAMRDLLLKKGEGDILAQMDGIIKKAGMRCAFTTAPFEDAKAALNQAVHLHLRAHNLNKRLMIIEDKLLESPDEATFASLQALKRELSDTDDTQALIEGFGTWNEDGA